MNTFHAKPQRLVYFFAFFLASLRETVLTHRVTATEECYPRNNARAGARDDDVSTLAGFKYIDIKIVNSSSIRILLPNKLKLIWLYNLGEPVK